MRHLMPTVALAFTLAGCSSTPNNPSLNLDTRKSASEYAQCVFPKWQQIKPEASMTESKGHYKLLVVSKVTSDEILEIYKGNPTTRVFLYQRAPLSSAFGRNGLEQAARDCL
ncbi:hypothetical protein [Pseudomonas sp. NFR16]|uniref:hypothetical protein n=1 Tax=Pseudomonas sp. NFR16 TaxID=1566248 RepID=UPI0008CB8BC0|nr:hypothetical protein [Pseudomonas sp. NFR16]SEI65360.1 hypothetical protein SAMN03159495_1197 [Pseudomonas sp. NFR16]